MRNIFGMVIGFALLLSLVVMTAAQNQPLAFEVASVKLVKNRECETRYEINASGMNYCNASLEAVISLAYGITKVVIPDKPDYDKGVFDRDIEIVAKTGHPVTRGQLLLMLQTLLADRFKLAVHREQRPETVYKLAVGRGVPKLHPNANPNGPSGYGPNPTGYGFTNHTMAEFCRIFLTGVLGAQVTDATGLKGSYDFLLKADFPEGHSAFDKEDVSQMTVASIIANIQELGLKLEAEKGQADYLVIDHAEKPSEN